MEKQTPAKKAAAPSVSQINAEYVTQVIYIVHVHYTSGRALCVEISFLCSFNAEDREIVSSPTVSFSNLPVNDLIRPPSHPELYVKDTHYILCYCTYCMCEMGRWGQMGGVYL